ncbi:MAG: hypothetical protein ACOY4I_13440 [Bacillota bacterium]
MRADDYHTALVLRTVPDNLPPKDVAGLDRVEGDLAETVRAMIIAKKPACQEQVAGRL